LEELEFKELESAPKEGSIGYRCEKPKGKDAIRPDCREGLCCGTAHKYTEDGRIVTEVCNTVDKTQYIY